MTNDVAPIQRSDRARSLFKGLRLLQSFSTGTPRMTLSECAEAVGMNRATARRFLLTLLDLGFLQQEGRYFSLTPKVLTLGFNYLSTLPWWQPSLPIIENVSRALEVACSIGVLSEDELVIVARVQGPSVFSVNLGAGRPLPVHVTAMGRVLLADLSTDMLEVLLSRADLISLTPATETNPGKLRKDLVQVREQGYSIVDQELELGLRSIAVPISNRNGIAIAALGVSTNTAQCSIKDMIARVLPIIRDASRAISANISF